jgi:hypothetical protein
LIHKKTRGQKSRATVPLPLFVAGEVKVDPADFDFKLWETYNVLNFFIYRKPIPEEKVLQIFFTERQHQK